MPVRWRWVSGTVVASTIMVGGCNRAAAPPAEQRSGRQLVVQSPTPGAAPQATPAAFPVRDRESVLITGVPHVRQRPDFCGEAAAEMWLSFLDEPVTQDQVFAAFDRSIAIVRSLLVAAIARLPAPGE